MVVMWKLVAVLGAVGCGTVQGLADAHATTDAPLDGFACIAPNLTCSDTCIDPLTDDDYCGNCATNCTTQSLGCLSGTCVDVTASCAIILQHDPTAPSGPYTHTADGKQFFCDMTGATPTQYDELGMGQYDIAYSGFTLIDGAMLQDPVVQQAFIWLYNHQSGGALALATWTSGNVCITSAAIGGNRLTFGGSLLWPAPTAGGGTTFDYTIGVLYSPGLEADGIYPPVPVPTDFFTTYPPADAANCSDNLNPALFFERH